MAGLGGPAPYHSIARFCTDLPPDLPAILRAQMDFQIGDPEISRSRPFDRRASLRPQERCVECGQPCARPSDYRPFGIGPPRRNPLKSQRREVQRAIGAIGQPFRRAAPHGR